MAICTFSVLTVSAYSTPVLAVSVSSSEVSVGSSVNVTVKYSVSDTDIGALDGKITYNSGVLEYKSSDGSIAANGSGGVINLSYFAKDSGTKSVSVTLEFKAVGTGSAQISVNTASDSFVNFDMESIGAPGNKSVTVQVKDNAKSSNANLKSIDIGVADSSGKSLKYSLSPNFSSGTVNYTLKVPENTATVSLSGHADDSAASCAVSGPYKFTANTGTKKITVTAEDGTQKVYTFNVVRNTAETVSGTESKEQPSSSDEIEKALGIVVDDQQYNILTDFTGITAPPGFSEDISDYNGIDIPVMISSDKKTMLVAVIDGTEPAFFIYHKQTIDFSPYKKTTIGTVEYVLDDAMYYADMLENYISKTITIGEVELKAYTVSSDSDFYLVWAIKNDGIGCLYIYDGAENTIQRYNNGFTVSANIDVTEIDENKIEKNNSSTVIVVLAVMVAVMLAGFITLLVLRLKNHVFTIL